MTNPAKRPDKGAAELALGEDLQKVIGQLHDGATKVELVTAYSPKAKLTAYWMGDTFRIDGKWIE